MQRHFIPGLFVFIILLLQSFFMLRLQPTGNNAAEAAGVASQRQRPTPTPRPTPRQNINGGGGVSERGNANDSSNSNRSGPDVFIHDRRPRSRIVPDIRRPHSNVNTNSNSKVDDRNVRGHSTDVFATVPSMRLSRHRIRHRRSALTKKIMRAGRETRLSASTSGAIIPEPPADFSGTYTGRVFYEAHGASDEEAILTVTGNRYTLTSASLKYSGRFIVHTNRGYHAVIMELGPPTPGQLFATFISMSARRISPDGFTLTSVAGERQKFSFISRGAKGDL